MHVERAKSYTLYMIAAYPSVKFIESTTNIFIFISGVDHDQIRIPLSLSRAHKTVIKSK